MSTNAATEEALGLIHKAVADKLNEMMQNPKTEAQAVKMAIDFLNKNNVVCVKNELEAVGELDKSLMKRKRRFGKEDVSIADFASERAKRAINE